jgi:hypothetical protein
MFCYAHMQRLFGYISGRNEQQQHVQMTTPVVVKVAPDIFGFKPNFTVLFFLPYKYQVGAPAKLNLNKLDVKGFVPCSVVCDGADVVTAP